MTTSPPSNPTPRSISNLIQHIVLVLPRLKRSPALLPPPIPPVQPVRGLPLHHRHRGKGPKPVKRCVAVEMRRPVTCGQEKGASKEQNRRDDTRGLRMKDETMCVWLEQHVSWPSNANTAHYMRCPLCSFVFDPSLIALSLNISPFPHISQLPPFSPHFSSPPSPLLSSLLLPSYHLCTPCIPTVHAPNAPSPNSPGDSSHDSRTVPPPTPDTCSYSSAAHPVPKRRVLRPRGHTRVRVLR